MITRAYLRAVAAALLLLSLAFMQTARHAGAAPFVPQPRGVAAISQMRPAAAFMPVVIEWFSISRPAVGQREIVHVQVLNNNQPVRGARLAVTITLGKGMLLLRVRGGVTNRKGLTQATFTVPRTARGKMLRVVVRLTYKAAHLDGRNDLTVRG